MITSKDIADRLPLTKEQKTALTEAIDMIYNEGFEKAKRKAVQAFDEMWFGTEDNPAPDEFDPDYHYHRKRFINALDNSENSIVGSLVKP